jgi:hypothetical protein
MSDPTHPKIYATSQWRYIGPLPGRGEFHAVLFAGLSEVVTWSGERTWLGTPEDFLEQFRFHKHGPGQS